MDLFFQLNDEFIFFSNSLFLFENSFSTFILCPPQALEAQEQEKNRLSLPQNASPVPGGRRSASPRSDRTPTPDPQSSPSPAASTPDLTNTTTRSTPPPPASDLEPDQAADSPSISGESEGGSTPMNGGAEPVTPSKGVRFEAPVQI